VFVYEVSLACCLTSGHNFAVPRGMLESRILDTLSDGEARVVREIAEALKLEGVDEVVRALYSMASQGMIIVNRDVMPRSFIAADRAQRVRDCAAVTPERRPRNTNRERSRSPQKHPKMVEPVDRFMQHLADMKPSFEMIGTQKEGVIYVRNVDGQHGRALASIVHGEMLQMNEGSLTGYVGGHALEVVADSLIDYLRRHREAIAHMPLLSRPHPGWSDSWVGLWAGGESMRPHRDGVAGGSVLVVFSLGLDTQSNTWLEGQLVERVLRSGDCMVLDGAMVRHSIQVLNTSSMPLQENTWLRDSRCSVLVRQRPPMDGRQVFRIGKHSGKNFAQALMEDPGYATLTLKLAEPKGDIADFASFLVRHS